MGGETRLRSLATTGKQTRSSLEDWHPDSRWAQNSGNHLRRLLRHIIRSASEASLPQLDVCAISARWREAAASLVEAEESAQPVVYFGLAYIAYMDIFGYTAWQAPWSRSRSQLQGSFEANIWRFGMAEAESRALLDPRESKSVTTEGGRNGTWLCKVYELVTASKHSERHVLYGLVKKWTYCKKIRVWQEIRSSSSVTGSWIDAASKKQQDKWGKVMPPCRGYWYHFGGPLTLRLLNNV